MKSEVNEIAFCARVLGALFYYAPGSPQAAPLVEALREGGWLSQWPYPEAASRQTAAGFREPDGEETLEQAWQRLFIGPWALPAPPWGSVWLDRESVLFGDSTLALRQWMRDNAIVFGTTGSEPEDHIGLLLLMAAWLAENDNTQALEQLLAWHLLPWADRFLQVFSENAGHPFYAALGILTRQTLAQWRKGLLTPVAVKQLYR